MVDTVIPSGLRVQQWDDKFFQEYLRSNRFAKYMAGGENAIIHSKQNLTKKKGDKITFALVNELKSAGVTGNQVLEGNEEALGTRSHPVTVDALRHGVLVTDLEEQASPIGLRNAAKTRLKNWAMKQLRGNIITAMGSIDGVAYSAATAVQKNTWQVNNADRVLFGATSANDTGVHSTSLTNVDAVGDKLTPSMVSLAKRLAQAASPGIHPVTRKGDEEWFVMFCHSHAFRDLKGTVEMMQANREAWTRGQDNPLFSGGDLIWDGVIIKEVPEFADLGLVGATGAMVVPNHLCGAQAVGVAWAQRTKTATQDTDYNFRHGVAVQEIRGVEKLRFGTGVNDTDIPKDHGMVTVFTAGAAD